MLKQMILAISIGLALAALLHRSFESAVTAVPLVAASRADQAQSPTPPPASGQPAQASMAEMMKRHQGMMADITAADLKLDELVTKMNAATGEAKVAAIAQVVSELVHQQKTMHEHMGMMEQQMMMGGRGMMSK